MKVAHGWYTMIINCISESFLSYYNKKYEGDGVKKILFLLVVSFVVVGCSSETELEVNVDEQVEEVVEGRNTEESESVYREANLDLDKFIDSYNSMASELDKETLERNGTDDISSDGLVILVNDNETISSISKPFDATLADVVTILTALTEQTEKADTERIERYMAELLESTDNDEPFNRSVRIHTMNIKVDIINTELIDINIEGDKVDEEKV